MMMSHIVLVRDGWSGGLPPESCVIKISPKLKSKFFNVVIGLNLLYGSEC